MVETMRKMKDSGVEWIGEIPEEWKVSKSKYFLDIKSGMFLSNNEYVDEGQYSVIGGNGINGYCNGANVYEHCIVIGRVGALCGNIHLVEEPCWITDNALIVTIDSSRDIKYIYYLLKAYDLNREANRSAQPLITGTQVSNMIIPINSKEEQQQIADYLDKKCAEIDSVIKSKELTNQKLKQYRQSIIYETVTKGLDKNVPMKDSGIEWIGEIPEEWKVKELRYIFEFGTGLTITRSELLDEGIPCINYGEIHSKYGFDLDLSRDYLKYADKNLLASKANCIVRNEDFIFCDTSEDIEGSGNCVYISNSNYQDIFAGSHTIIGRLTVDINSRYLAYLFGTNSWRAQIRSLVYGVKVFSITQSILKKAKAIVPPTRVQNQICNYLDKKCAEIDSVISANEITIKKLKEYRQSVIFEAVTGKMDIESLS